MNRRARIADAISVAGGAALLGSAFLHWVRRGPGSSLRGHDLVDTVVALGSALPGLDATRLTLLWYLVPASGAVVWITVALAGTASRPMLVIALATASVTLATVVAFVRLTALADLDAGAWLAVAGAALVLGATLAARRAPPGA